MVYTQPDVLVASMAFSVVIIVIFLLFVDGIISRLHPKSRQHRELLSDMYVVGKIKQIAKADAVDLEKELKEYLRFRKIEKLSLKSLDRALEEEMKEKISNDFEAAAEKVKTKKE